MTTTRRRWPIVLAGVAVVVIVVIIALAVAGSLFIRDHVQVARGAGRENAEAAFDAARRRYADGRPLLVLDADRRPVLTPGLESRRNPGTVTTLHVLAWDAGEDALATVTLPMWLLRLKRGPIAFGEYASGLDEGVRLDPDDLERHGPGIVLDFEAPDGKRVLITAQ